MLTAKPRLQASLIHQVITLEYSPRFLPVTVSPFLSPESVIHIDLTQRTLHTGADFVHTLPHGWLRWDMAHMKSIAEKLRVIIGFMDGFEVSVPTEYTDKHGL